VNVVQQPEKMIVVQQPEKVNVVQPSKSNDVQQPAKVNVVPQNQVEMSEVHSRPTFRVILKRMNKKGGVEIELPNTIDEILQQASSRFHMNALKVRRVDTEVEVTDIKFIQPNDTLYVTNEQDEQDFA